MTVQTVGVLAAVSALVAAVGTFGLIVLSTRGKRTATSPPALGSGGQDILRDPRSCLQVALRIVARALSESANGESTAKPARQIINLLQAEADLAFAEVIDDRLFSTIESRTRASTVWIVTTDEMIEFDYPEASVSFSNIVLGNLRRDIRYRYMVVDTPTARGRAAKLGEFVAAQDLGHQLEVRFLSASSGLERATSFDELVVFEIQDRPELYYLLPGSGRPDSVLQRWIKASDRSANERMANLKTMWELDAGT